MSKSAQKKFFTNASVYSKDVSFRSLCNMVIKEVQRVNTLIPLTHVSMTHKLIAETIHKVLVNERALQYNNRSSAADIESSINKQLKKNGWLSNISSQQLDKFWRTNARFIHQYLNNAKHQDSNIAQERLVNELTPLFIKLFNL